MGLTDKMCRVTVDGELREYPKGTAYQRIAEEFQDRYEHQIILAYEGAYRLRELSKTLEEDCSLRFVTTADRIGHSTYKRSMCFLLVKAVHDVAGHDRIDRVRIHFSLDKGYYCTVEGDVCLDERFLERVAGRMRELSEQKIPINKRSVHTEEAVALFHRHGMYDKERLFEYRRVSKVNIYSINEFEDYFYGYMAPDAGCLKYFSLHLYDGGFVIQMPVRENAFKSIFQSFFGNGFCQIKIDHIPYFAKHGGNRDPSPDSCVAVPYFFRFAGYICISIYRLELHGIPFPHAHSGIKKHK